MKKVVTLLMCLALLISCFCVFTSGVKNNLGTTKLTSLTATPDIKTLDILSKDLSCSPEYDKSGTHTPGTITAAQAADLAKITYGISAIGVGSLDRPLAAVSDGLWAKGNYGAALEGGNTNLAEGAFSAKGDGNFYNVKGEKDKSDSVYSFLLTYNFGEKAKLDSIAFAGANEQVTATTRAVFQAADVYVSNDGVNWTCIGYWNRTDIRMANFEDDFPRIDAGPLGMDDSGTILSGKCLFGFDLNDVEAQYLRIAATQLGGYSNPSDKTNADTYASGYDVTFGWRETFVFGKKLSAVNTTAGATTAGSTTAGMTMPVVTTKAATTKAAETEAVVDATTAATTEEAKSGCGSYIPGSIVMIAAATAGCATISKKRRKK